MLWMNARCSGGLLTTSRSGTANEMSPTGRKARICQVHRTVERITKAYIKAATPRLNGKVERSHRIDNEEFYRLLDGVVIEDTEMFNDKLDEWQNFYNFDRPHGGLAGQTPYERLQEKTTQATKAQL